MGEHTGADALREQVAEIVATAIMASPDVHLHWTREEAKERRGHSAADHILALLRPAADEGAGKREELLERIDLFLGGEWDTSYEAAAALLREARTLLATPAAPGAGGER